MTDTASNTQPREHQFQADVNQVLDIVIHSLYSHREIFLRELISNASDAIDKLRFKALTDHELMGDDSDLEIHLIPNKEEKTLIISDNGIGMTEEELIEYLGTVAHSGSRRFLEAVKESGAKEDVDMIGRFGVGFYSAFLVAERVEVTSLPAGAESAVQWTSDAKGGFTIQAAPDKTRRGTDIKLYLRDDQAEFTEEHRLRTLIQRYSDFVSHPIKLLVEREEGEGDEVTKTQSYEVINQASALWKRPKAEITDEQYEEFYKHLTHDWEPPLAHTHFTVEGSQLFTGLLYVPKRAPFDLYDRNQRRGVRLYVKRVFIMDDCEQLLPEWLRFVRGIIDSDDLPLNVSRELLQEDRIVRVIRKQVIKKSLDLLEQMASDKPEDYDAFWEIYGAVLKEGLHFDAERRENLAPLMRYASSKKDRTSLSDYVSRMPEDQEAIYYVMGPNRQAVEGSPHIEGLKKKGYEVLFMTDAIDEWAMEGLTEFEGKKLVSATKADLSLDGEGDSQDDQSATEDAEGPIKDLTERARVALQEQVSEVRLSKRLIDSPSCLVVPDGGLSAHIERMLRSQNKDMPASKRIFELNPSHPVVEKLAALNQSDPKNPQISDWISMLYDQALLAEGSPVPDPQSFARRMGSLMTSALGAVAAKSSGAKTSESGSEAEGESEGASEGA